MVDITTPIYILDANTTYTLMNNIIMTGPFTLVGTGVTVDGKGFTITINSVPGFTGLFPVAVTVQNLGIKPSGTTTLATNAGWFFANGIPGIATNCYSTGTIGAAGGGIFGANCTGTATNCYTSGSISYDSPD